MKKGKSDAQKLDQLILSIAKLWFQSKFKLRSLCNREQQNKKRIEEQLAQLAIIKGAKDLLVAKRRECGEIAYKC